MDKFIDKLRVYDKIDKYVYKIHSLNSDGSVTLRDNSRGVLLYRDSSDVQISQFIGIYDKNNLPIYEDDAVLCGGKIYYISFWLGSFCMTLKDDSSINHFTLSDFDKEEIDGFEVVRTNYYINNR
jgi:hypothetical protein